MPEAKLQDFLSPCWPLSPAVPGVLRSALPFISTLASQRQIRVTPHLAFALDGSRFDTQAQKAEAAGPSANAAPLGRATTRNVEETPANENVEPVRNTVMDDLVQMAASDDGVLKEELFSIDECLTNVMVLQKPVCEKKRIRLELKKSVSMPEQAIGDKAKLQRALVSLLESVTEQTPEGGVINLGCRADRASGNRVYLYFTIRDNGSSIASELMQGMFEMKDERDDPLRAGLYTAREIVRIMGGNVRVRSRRGEGTEFMVTVCMNMP